MINYAPIKERKSLIEQCILQAFKDSYRAQDLAIRQAIEDNKVLTKEESLVYESFKLSKANQDYKIGSSILLDNAMSFFEKMDQIEPKHFDHRKDRRNNKDVMFIQPPRNLFNGSDFDINQIDSKMSYVAAIKLIHALYKSNPDSIYGVLLSAGSNKFFNPLHPLNAQSFVRKYNMDKYENEFITETSKDIYTVIIYTYKNKKELQHNFPAQYEQKYKTFFIEHLLNILATMDVKQEISTKITSIRSISNITRHDNPNLRDPYSYANYEYSYELINPNGSQEISETYLQPVQLINTGLAYPFYGITAVKYVHGGSTRGYQLSPMYSCNIGETCVYKYDDGSLEIQGGSVCTGNYNNSSPEGRATLNHANLSSAFFGNVLSTGSFTFSDACVQLSVSIYAEFLGLDPVSIATEPEIKIPISFEEFKRQNKNATLVQYLASLK